MKHLIALYSPEPRSGKSTTAHILTEAMFGTVVSFAAPFYDFVLDIASPFVKGGRAELGQWLRDERKDHEVIPDLGMTLRDMLISCGMWGRNSVHQDIWKLIAKKKIEKGLKSYSVIVDDLRFTNEYDMIRSMGGLCIKVVRTDHDATGVPSEGMLCKHHFDKVIFNDGSVEDLNCKVREFARDLSWAMAA